VSWALTPRFHPYPPAGGRLFSVALSVIASLLLQYLPVRKYGALCCPDFPLFALQQKAIERPANEKELFIFKCKDTKSVQSTQISGTLRCLKIYFNFDSIP